MPNADRLIGNLWRAIDLLNHPPDGNSMTEDQFAQAAGLSAAQAERWYAPVESAMFEFSIVSPARAAMFIAQIGHESGGFVYTRELWGPTTVQSKYNSRDDLGNTRPEAIRVARAHNSNPGFWWRGGGLIQTTGYDNFKLTGAAFDLDLLNHPELIEIPANAARSAAWWWSVHGCNDLADAGDFLALTRRINGGTNGIVDRRARYDRAKLFL